MNALLLLGGDAPPEWLAHRCASESDIILCADGAANWAIPMGLRIDVLIGDMDSIDKRYLHDLSNTDIQISPREKDETDGQLALDLAMARGADSIVMLGGIGGRTDHFFGNIQLLVRAENRGVRAEMRGAKEILRVLGAGGHTLSGKFSLVPLGGGVWIDDMRGVQYPLHQVPLALDTPLGISNAATSPDARLIIQSGLVIYVQIID